jgi:hypothetical protein
MHENPASLRGGSGRALQLAMAVGIVMTIGWAVWTARMVDRMRMMVVENAQRLDVLERVGSPAVAEIRVLQMRAIESVVRRRIDALELAVIGLKDRLDTAPRTADPTHPQIDLRD